MATGGAPAATAKSPAWVVTTSLDKPDQKTRRLIRSHVMRGKNTRASRRTRQSSKPHAGDGDGQLLLLLPSRKGQLLTGDPPWFITTPRQVAYDVQMFGFEIELKPYMIDLLHKAINLVRPAFYGIEEAISGEKRKDIFCFSDETATPAMVHAMLFTTQAFHDFVTHAGGFGTVARHHLDQTFRLLQESLGSRETAAKVSTMSVVAALALAELITGDTETSAKHVAALYRLIDLAREMGVLGPSPMIDHKVQGIEFGIALSTGRRGRFYPESQLSWNPHPWLGGGLAITGHFPELGGLEPRPDPRLLHVWADLRAFSAAANQATGFGIKMPTGIYTDITDSAPCRLTHLLADDPSSLHELLRLSMMAFLKIILVGVPGIGRRMHYLRGQLKEAVLAHHDTRGAETAMGRLVLWVLFMAALSVFDDPGGHWVKEMLRESLAALDVRSWDRAREALTRFLWVNVAMDKRAEALYYECISNTETQIPS